MEKSIEVVLCLSAAVLIAYIYLWIAIVPLFVIGLFAGMPTEGWGFVFCLWLAGRCYQYGTTLWPIGLGAWFLTVTLELICQSRGWMQDPV